MRVVLVSRHAWGFYFLVIATALAWVNVVTGEEKAQQATVFAVIAAVAFLVWKE